VPKWGKSFLITPFRPPPNPGIITNPLTIPPKVPNPCVEISPFFLSPTNKGRKNSKILKNP